ncbi:MAG: nuclear transport factor 2 family protein [Coprobacillus sp.]
MNIQDFWKATLSQDANSMKEYFDSNAYIQWHNTNECFTVEEFIQANCEYPDKWDGVIERIEKINDLIITVTHVFAVNKPLSFHVTSFIRIKVNKIVSIDEYWGDDGVAPQWRLDKHIGKPIK